MKIVILGGTGLIGSSLKEDLLSDHEVECFGRVPFTHLINYYLILKEVI